MCTYRYVTHVCMHVETRGGYQVSLTLAPQQRISHQIWHSLVGWLPLELYGLTSTTPVLEFQTHVDRPRYFYMGAGDLILLLL